jgi:PBP1b-binding outer membrane lipoprotein LpoB
MLVLHPSIFSLRLKSASILVSFVFLSGCVVVMQKQDTAKAAQNQQSQQQQPQKVIRQLASKPVIAMSDEVVRSETGDMVSLLPSEWSLINLETNLPTQVFSVAVNSNYTASLVYSVVRKEETFDQTFQRDGLAGIAKISALKREHKMRNIKRLGEFEEVQVGTKRFCLYRYTTDNGSTLNRVAVFRSSFGNYYECTLTDMTFTGRKILPREESENIYLSVLATIDF